MKSIMQAKYLRLHYLLIIIILSVNVVFVVGDFEVRMGLTSGDDSPLAIANYFSHPEYYQYDTGIHNWIPVAMGSMQNWLAVGLHAFINIPPQITFYLFVFIQNVLLGLAIFRFSLSINSSIYVAWLVLVFSLNARVYTWNLAGYGDLMYTSYAAHLSLPFIIFAANYLLSGKFYLHLVFLLVGGLFHPGLAIYASACFGLFLLYGAYKSKDYKNLVRQFLLITVVLVIYLTPYWLAVRDVAKISDSYILPLLLSNQHAVPWLATGFLDKIFYRSLSLLFVLIMAIMAIQRGITSTKSNQFLATICVACIFLTITHVLVVYLEVVPLIRLILHRSTILIAMFCVPFAVGIVFDTFPKSLWLDRFVLICMFLIPSASVILSALLVIYSLNCQAGQTSRDRSFIAGKLKYLGYALCLLTTLPALINQVSFYFCSLLAAKFGWQIHGTYLPTLEGMYPFNPYVGGIYSFAPLIAAILAFADNAVRRIGALRLPGQLTDKPRFFSTASWSLLIILSLVFLMSYNQFVSKMMTSNEAKSNFLAQKWARDNTSPKAHFLLMETGPYYSWRSYADRPVVNAYSGGGPAWYYLMTKRAQDYNRRLDKFYIDNCPHEPKYKNDRVRPCLTELNQSQLELFSKEFHVNYIVTKTSKHRFTFPIVYKNQHFLIYKMLDPPL